MFLNLGCGNKLREDAVNHDLHKHRDGVDIAWDLNKIPWPWQDESFDLIYAIGVLEHLDIDLFASMAECWRILKPEGEMRIKLPYWNSDISHQDPSHRWFFSVKSLDQFDPSTKRGHDYSFYTPYKWKILNVKLNAAKSSITWNLQVLKDKSNGS